MPGIADIFIDSLNDGLRQNQQQQVPPIADFPSAPAQAPGRQSETPGQPSTPQPNPTLPGLVPDLFSRAITQGGFANPIAQTHQPPQQEPPAPTPAGQGPAVLSQAQALQAALTGGGGFLPGLASAFPALAAILGANLQPSSGFSHGGGGLAQFLIGGQDVQQGLAQVQSGIAPELLSIPAIQALFDPQNFSLNGPFAGVNPSPVTSQAALQALLGFIGG